MIGELNRRFKGDQDKATPTDKIIRSFRSLTVHAEWTRQLNPEAKEAVHTLCDFHGEDEDWLLAELKVFHTSFPSKDLK
ncbi:Hypothetical protein FKW44_002740 [Caligus rogercresseyi]|uniref:Uncharacterized protein n=1 Tax=Caligus rogercresseyi TaxID=217165 RepID=A0A7T8KKM1_CALRO|nr:Hypothetical protein FKW44_002740 [Caligus rogercresseyi]